MDNDLRNEHLEKVISAISADPTRVTVICKNDNEKVLIQKAVLDLNNVKHTKNIHYSYIACKLLVKYFYYKRLYTDNELSVELESYELDESSKLLLISYYMEAYELAVQWKCSFEVLMVIKNKIISLTNDVKDNFGNLMDKIVKLELYPHTKAEFFLWILCVVKDKKIKLSILDYLSELRSDLSTSDIILFFKDYVSQSSTTFEMFENDKGSFQTLKNDKGTFANNV